MPPKKPSPSVQANPKTNNPQRAALPVWIAARPLGYNTIIMALTIALQPEVEAWFYAEAAREGTSAEDWAAQRLADVAPQFRPRPDIPNTESETPLTPAEIAEIVSALSKVETAAQELTTQVESNNRLLRRNVTILEEARLIVAQSNARARAQEIASQ